VGVERRGIYHLELSIAPTATDQARQAHSEAERGMCGKVGIGCQG